MTSASCRVSKLKRSGLCSAAGFALLLCVCGSGVPAAGDESSLAGGLQSLAANVFPEEQRDAARRMVREHLRDGLQNANQRSSTTWRKVETLDDWQAFRDGRIGALRRSLGRWPEAPKKIDVRVTGTVKGDGYVIDNIVFQSRPDWWVTANLYHPAKPRAKMPGILLCHSHHRPKNHGELQDMGMTWARAGCLVLVPDHLGHGERGQHGFTSQSDFPREFRVSRQDYYFRYDNSMQLYLVGDSLMGWMVWDLMRGVDVLLAQQGIDESAIMLLGAVAGGGDPCAVTAALDERITCAVPFNFGGPQPETRYPLPEDVETSFNYAGGGSWESTRNLAFSAKVDQTFLPWEIVGGIAPRRLIFAHEFSWHRERDPVWKRLQRIYQLYEARDHLAYTHGRGELKGRPPHSTHCTHIGRFHRVKIHESFSQWFDIDVEEYNQRRESAELVSLTPQAEKQLQPKMLHELLAARADGQLAEARRARQALPVDDRREALRAAMSKLLGEMTSRSEKPKAVKLKNIPLEGTGAARIERVLLEHEGDLELPVLVISPTSRTSVPRPAVVCLAQSGKARFLDQRGEEIAGLLAEGIAVCLPEVRNTGETAADRGRGRYSAATARAATALMLGDPLVGGQVRDVAAVVRYLRDRKDIDGQRIALWGESFAPLNEPDTNFRVPRRIDGRPHQAEPLGGMLALLAALFDDEIAAVYIHRPLAEFRGVLDSPFVYVPLDSIVPSLLQHADMPDLAASLAPRPVQLAGAVDAYNRALSEKQMRQAYAPAIAAYADAADALELTSKDEPAAWLIETLQGK